jgi:hypothetical protein
MTIAVINKTIVVPYPNCPPEVAFSVIMGVMTEDEAARQGFAIKLWEGQVVEVEQSCDGQDCEHAPLSLVTADNGRQVIVMAADLDVIEDVTVTDEDWSRFETMLDDAFLDDQVSYSSWDDEDTDDNSWRDAVSDGTLTDTGEDEPW